jgi:hypothetical protein
MLTLDESLSRVMQIGGATAAAFVDYGTGAALRTAGDAGGGLDLAMAADGASSVVRAARASLAQLGFSNGVEDVLVTTPSRYHLVRTVRDGGGDALLLFVGLERTRANLALSLHEIARIERDLAS